MNGVEEDEIALKMRKKELRRGEKEKAAAQKKAAAERQQIEYRRFLKEMNREDPDFDKMAAKLPEAERLANEEEFLAMYAKLQAERAAAVKAAEDKKAHEAEFDLCSKLFDAEIQRNQADARQRLETVVALVGIVSFWRRVAAAPDSKAAKAAVARAAKRARAWA